MIAIFDGVAHPWVGLAVIVKQPWDDEPWKATIAGVYEHGGAASLILLRAGASAPESGVYVSHATFEDPAAALARLREWWSGRK